MEHLPAGVTSPHAGVRQGEERWRMGMTRVVAAVVRRDGRYLLCRRPAHKRHGGLWEFPGGKIEPGESILDAARRELAEELGVGVRAVGDLLHAAHDPGSPFVIEFHAVEVDGDPTCLEHAALAWVAAGDLAAYALAPSDREFVRQLLAGAPPRVLDTSEHRS